MRSLVFSWETIFKQDWTFKSRIFIQFPLNPTTKKLERILFFSIGVRSISTTSSSRLVC